MSYRDRPRLWKVAYYILEDDGAMAVPLGEHVTHCGKGGGRIWQEWAIDLRSLVDEGWLPVVDSLYLTPSNDYRRIPSAIKPVIRRLWKEAGQRGLVRQGLSIADTCHG
jgi:hypothetical protein